MGLFKTLFRRGSRGPGGRTSDAGDSDLSETREGRDHLRRELVHVVVRDTMRIRGIPSDWLTAMVLPLPGGAAGRGLHVLLVVRQGHEQMLAYVPAFQRSFFTALRQFDPRALEWLVGLSWQFDGMSEDVGAAALPPRADQALAPTATAAGAGVDSVDEDELSVQEDLRALFAIRDEALLSPDSAPPESDFQPTQPLQ